MAALGVVACLGVSTAPAGAQVYYTINGQPAPHNVAMYMASNGLPAGHYWLDAQGYWGVVGNPNPMGNIYAQQAQPAPHVGLSQRGMLYRPGEILNGN